MFREKRGAAIRQLHPLHQALPLVAGHVGFIIVERDRGGIGPSCILAPPPGPTMSAA